MNHWFLDPSNFVNEEYGKYKGKRNGFEDCLTCSHTQPWVPVFGVEFFFDISLKFKV